MAKKKSNPEPDDEPSAIGWDAINAALAPVYGAGEPDFHYGTVVPAFLGGNDPLQGISVYRRDEPVPHWHYVTLGFTELYEKESDDPEVNGFGFELTFRLRRGPEKEPPAWVMNLLQNLARYVFKSGNAFQARHTLDCNGKIALESDTELTCLLFIQDPELPPYTCPHGEATFLEVVGITADEHRQIQAWNAKGFTEIVLDEIPLGVTDLSRPSLLASPAIRARVDEGVRREGSACDMLFVGEESFAADDDRLRLVFGALAARAVREVLPARLNFDRPLTIRSSTSLVTFRPGTGLSWTTIGDDELEVTVGAAESRALLDALVPTAGIRPVAGHPQVTVEVRKSLIRDAEGKVVNEIG